MITSVIEKAVFKQTYSCFEGDTWDTFILTWRNPDRTPVDFTTATARCQFKRNRNDATAVLTLTHSSGITLGNSTENIKLLLTDVQTAQLGAGTFYFDIEITQNGKVRTYVDAVLSLKQSITQPTP